MFSLHERTQRQVCRTAFVAFCALPTIIVLGWVAYFHRPWSERDWQSSIERTLHVGASIGEISAPRPLVRKISKLSLTDLETKLPLVEFDSLVVHDVEEIEAEHVTIQAEQFADIATAIQIWLAGNNFANINWQAKQVTLFGAEQQQFRLKNVAIKSQSTSAGTRQIVIQCSAGPRLVIERSSAGTTHCQLDSTKTKLPAWVLADTLPGARRWPQASFTGVVQLQKNRDSLSGSFKGEIDGIDCREWIGSDSLRAHAKLRIEEFTWQSGRLESLQGLLETEEGQISVDLVTALNKVLYCQLAKETLPKVADLITFERLACRFRLNSAGLTCVNPETNGPGVLIMAEGKPLVMQPAYSNLPLTNFVQLFFPLERDLLPGTREATDLGEKLPLPESTKRK